MTEPPTLILWDADADADEERTLVDRAQLSSPEPAFAGAVHPVPESSQSEDRDRAEHEAKQSKRCEPGVRCCRGTGARSSRSARLSLSSLALVRSSTNNG